MRRDRHVADPCLAFGFLHHRRGRFGPDHGTGDVQGTGRRRTVSIADDHHIFASKFSQLTESGLAPGSQQHHRLVAIGHGLGVRVQLGQCCGLDPCAGP